MTGPEITSLIASIVSVVVAVFAVIMALFFFFISLRSERKTSETAIKIELRVDDLKNRLDLFENKLVDAITRSQSNLEQYLLTTSNPEAANEVRERQQIEINEIASQGTDEVITKVLESFGNRADQSEAEISQIREEMNEILSRVAADSEAVAAQSRLDTAVRMLFR